MVGLVLIIAGVGITLVVMLSAIERQIKAIRDEHARSNRILENAREGIPDTDELKRYVAAVYESKSAREYTEAVNQLVEWVRR